MTNSDRELLMDAARAAGMTPVRLTDDGTALLLEGVQEPWNALHENPHSDCMGDALRLAVRLNLFFKPELAHFLGLARFAAQDRDDCYAHRLAIVRAAAQLWRDKT